MKDIRSVSGVHDWLRFPISKKKNFEAIPKVKQAVQQLILNSHRLGNEVNFERNEEDENYKSLEEMREIAKEICEGKTELTEIQRQELVRLNQDNRRRREQELRKYQDKKR